MVVEKYSFLTFLFFAANLVDWDLVEGKTNAESKYKYIMSHDKIYFIDRNESMNDSVKIYPVKRRVPKF